MGKVVLTGEPPYRTLESKDTIKLTKYEVYLIKYRDWKKSNESTLDTIKVVSVVCFFMFVLFYSILLSVEHYNNSLFAKTTTAAQQWASNHHTTLNHCERTDAVTICQMSDGTVLHYDLGLTIPKAVTRIE